MTSTPVKTVSLNTSQNSWDNVNFTVEYFDNGGGEYYPNVTICTGTDVCTSIKMWNNSINSTFLRKLADALDRAEAELGMRK